jgi:aquaglyceroporin related protein, other eukaryote
LEEGSCKHSGPPSFASDIDAQCASISQGYILAQILGGVAGASIIYANYSQALNLVEGGRNVRSELTRGLFATYPVSYCFFAIDRVPPVLNEASQSSYLSPAGAFFSEFLGTVVLMLMVLAINDKKNCPTPPGLAPLFLFLLVTGLGTSLGMQTGQSISFLICLLSLF